ncbi:lecithin retinol acyltransferase family protein [Celeribacter ethanolicus]|uniref:lecithin retinol acyltransferase family protein n=1 Tax=Celeribacter ethanolicus TaxID=1758178 RepID=UPI00138F8845|nr:lecithin retinol acyltransferase family protein [Celeribacter ethanolicus]
MRDPFRIFPIIVNIAIQLICQKGVYSKMLAGTIIKTLKFPVTHYGIYIGNGQVIDNSPKRGAVGVTTISDFKRDGVCEIVNAPPSTQEGSRRCGLAHQRIGKPYHLLQQNCEHFVTEIMTGTAKSTQVAIAATIGIAAFTLSKGDLPQKMATSALAASGVLLLMSAISPTQSLKKV